MSAQGQAGFVNDTGGGASLSHQLVLFNLATSMDKPLYLGSLQQFHTFK